MYLLLNIATNIICQYVYETEIICYCVITTHLSPQETLSI